MLSKKNLCQNWKLYIITDFGAAKGRDMQILVDEALSAGADVLQLRHKSASNEELLGLAAKLLEVTRKHHKPLIINDRLDIAKRSGADGAHLGQEDENYAHARAFLGSDAILGQSTHSPEQAFHAQNEGFDYIGVGPVFATPTKPDYRAVGIELVSFVSKNINIPFVAIGGIDASNIGQVRKAGAKTVAVVRAVMGADSAAQAVKALLV